jgi:hypothetical protein
VAKLASELNNSLIQLESYEKATKHDYKTAWKRLLKFGSRQFREFTVTYPDYRGKFKQNKQLFLATDPRGLFHAFKEYLYELECSEQLEEEEDITVNVFKAQVAPKEEKTRFSNDDETPDVVKKAKPGNSGCFLCGEDHWASDCILTLKERHAVFNQKQLCKNCGQPGHIVKDCRSRGRCKNCFKDKSLKDGERKHNTFLCPNKDSSTYRSYNDEGSRKSRSKEKSDDRPRRRSPSPNRRSDRNDSRKGGKHSHRTKDSPQKKSPSKHELQMEKTLKELQDRINKMEEEKKKSAGEENKKA